MDFLIRQCVSTNTVGKYEALVAWHQNRKSTHSKIICVLLRQLTYFKRSIVSSILINNTTLCKIEEYTHIIFIVELPSDKQ